VPQHVAIFIEPIMKADSEPTSLDTSAVKSRKDFVSFLNYLLIDYQQNGREWESQSLGNFLEALVAYTADIDGYHHTTSVGIDADIASWRVFADILSGATTYE
jgi:hypothetical protein